MSDISFPGSPRAGLPAFEFVTNEGRPSVATGARRFTEAFQQALPKPLEPRLLGTVFVEETSVETAALATPVVPARRRDRLWAHAGWIWRSARAHLNAAHRAGCASMRPAMPAFRLLARATAFLLWIALGILRYLGRLCWRVARRWPATSLGASGGMLFVGVAMVPILAGASDGRIDEPGRTAPGHVWASINRPARIYSLDHPDLGPDATGYAASRDQDGPGRSDTLTFGTHRGEDRPWLHLTIATEGGPPFGGGLDTALERQAALSRTVVLRSGKATPLPTRFGAFAVADVVLGSPGSKRGALDCLAFQLAANNPGVRIEGLACEAPNRRIDRGALSCMIDRIDLVSSGRDRATGSFFALAEAGRRRECGRGGAMRSAIIPATRLELRGRIASVR
ncbi:MAG: hypothetical protein JWM36_1251 [Hyphomicrobiales bacterium]|nr:hypothetical protein [Hyphomicrobiales bacterium]